MKARERLGQTSMTSATPSDHSPPIPSAATNRNTPNCQAVAAMPHNPVNNGIRQHAQRHGPHAADAIAQPAKEHAAGGGADQKAGRNHAEPKPNLLLAGTGEARSCKAGPADHGKDAHLGAVKHPAQQRGEQGHPLTGADSPVLRIGGQRFAERICNQVFAAMVVWLR